MYLLLPLFNFRCSSAAMAIKKERREKKDAWISAELLSSVFFTPFPLLFIYFTILCFLANACLGRAFVRKVICCVSSVGSRTTHRLHTFHTTIYAYMRRRRRKKKTRKKQNQCTDKIKGLLLWLATSSFPPFLFLFSPLFFFSSPVSFSALEHLLTLNIYIHRHDKLNNINKDGEPICWAAA